MFDQAFLDAHHVSASQIETFDLCNRKWGLNKLDGIKPKDNKYAQRGTAVHHELELWQRDGKPLDLTSEAGKIASAGLRFLPKPGTHDVEDNFVMRTATATYRGLKDIRSRPPVPIAVVYDHKSTTDFKWMKTPEKLRGDVQSNLYAVDEIKRAESENRKLYRVELNWIYYLANPSKPKARRVLLYVLPDKSMPAPPKPADVDAKHYGHMYYDELYENFERIEASAAKMVQHYADKPSGMSLPFNIDACQAYGGCPYANEQCTFSFGERIRSMEAQQSLADKMKASVNKQGAAPAATAATSAAAAPTTPATTASTTKPSAGIPKLVDAIKAGAAAAPAVNPPEEAAGVDPDAPAGTAATPDTVVGAPGVASAPLRVSTAVSIAQSIVTARIYPPEDARYGQKVAKLAVEVTDALQTALDKK